MSVRFAILDDSDVVINITRADLHFGSNQGWITSETAAIGQVYNHQSSTFAAPHVTTADRRAALFNAVSDQYEYLKDNPRCETGLGFNVDSGYENLTDFREGIELYRLYTADPVAFETTQPAALVAAAQQLIVNENGAYMMRVRSYDNNYHLVTDTEMDQIISKIVTWGFALKTYKWTLEEMIAEATDAQLDGIDIEAGWPS